jgi:tetratricopeptide (TPR) repeat protein
MPESGPALDIPDDLGTLEMVADMPAGGLKTRTRVNIKDIQQVAALFASLETKTQQVPAGPADSPSPSDAPAAAGLPLTKTVEATDTPAFWMDRGGLLSAYGNYAGAIRCFRKALVLDPDLAEAYFQQGIAYGELGQFDSAVGAISEAIDRDPGNGAYFYGRARVYLRAGDDDLAMKDFMEAGFLGDENARAYLKRAGVDWQ